MPNLVKIDLMVLEMMTECEKLNTTTTTKAHLILWLR